MYSLRLKCAPAEVDLISGDLWEAGTAGIRELAEKDAVVLIAGFANNNARASLLDRFAQHHPQWSQEASTDWLAVSQNAWPGREIGARIFLAPVWSTTETPAGRLRILHNPGLACGTGEHPCTQLAMAALESADVSGKTIVDIGTGSGLLAVAALCLGAQFAIGVDTDAAALSAAHENFALNKYHSTLAAGSADCLRAACADITIANISGTVLLSIADELLRITAPRGSLILTGFRDYEVRALEQTFGYGAVTSCGDWRCLYVPAP